MVQVHLAALTGCEEGIEQFQNDYREVLRLHSIDAYEQYISANDKKPPKQIKALADDLMNALKMHDFTCFTAKKTINEATRADQTDLPWKKL